MSDNSQLGAGGRVLSHVVEQRYEPEIHVQLLVTTEQRQPRIVSNEVDFRFLIASQHDHIFEIPEVAFPETLVSSKLWRWRWIGWMSSLALQHVYPIAFALLEVKGSRSHFASHRISHAIDGLLCYSLRK